MIRIIFIKQLTFVPIPMKDVINLKDLDNLISIPFKASLFLKKTPDERFFQKIKQKLYIVFSINKESEVKLQ